MRLNAAFPATAWALHNDGVSVPKTKTVKEYRLNLCGLHFFSHMVQKNDGFTVKYTFGNVLSNVLKKGLFPATLLMDVVSLVYKNTIGFLIHQIAKVFSNERKPVAPVAAKKGAKAPVAPAHVAKAHPAAKKPAVPVKA